MSTPDLLSTNARQCGPVVAPSPMGQSTCSQPARQSDVACSSPASLLLLLLLLQRSDPWSSDRWIWPGPGLLPLCPFFLSFLFFFFLSLLFFHPNPSPRGQSKLWRFGIRGCLCFSQRLVATENRPAETSMLLEARKPTPRAPVPDLYNLGASASLSSTTVLGLGPRYSGARNGLSACFY